MTTSDALKAAGMEAVQRKAWDTAVEKFDAARQLFAAEGNKAGEAEMWNNLGVVYRRQYYHDEAHNASENAIQLFKQLNLKREQGQALGNLADLYVAKKQPKQVVASYLQSEQLLKEAKAHDERSQILRALSLYQLRRGHWLESIRWMEGSLSAKPRIGPSDWLFRMLLRFALNLLGLTRVE